MASESAENGISLSAQDADAYIAYAVSAAYAVDAPFLSMLSMIIRLPSAVPSLDLPIYAADAAFGVSLHALMKMVG